MERPTHLKDILVAVTGAGRREVNGLYKMYMKGDLVKSYAGRLMWKQMEVPRRSVINGDSTVGLGHGSPYMLFHDGEKWWIGYGLYRCHADSDVNDTNLFSRGLL